jgi:hypothetical protein
MQDKGEKTMLQAGIKGQSGDGSLIDFPIDPK